MAKKPKEEKPVEQVEEKKPALIKDLDSLREFLIENKLNPLEKVMATELLINGYEFYPQYKIDVPEGWTINGKKYFVADFLIPERSIIIETEGKIHDNERNYQYDRNRFNTLSCLGYRIFRFNWDDVMNKEGFDIMEFIWQVEMSIDSFESEIWQRARAKINDADGKI